MLSFRRFLLFAQFTDLVLRASSSMTPCSDFDNHRVVVTFGLEVDCPFCESEGEKKRLFKDDIVEYLGQMYATELAREVEVDILNFRSGIGSTHVVHSLEVMDPGQQLSVLDTTLAVVALKKNIISNNMTALIGRHVIPALPDVGVIVELAATREIVEIAVSLSDPCFLFDALSLCDSDKRCFSTGGIPTCMCLDGRLSAQCGDLSLNIIANSRSYNRGEEAEVIRERSNNRSPPENSRLQNEHQEVSRSVADDFLADTKDGDGNTALIVVAVSCGALAVGMLVMCTCYAIHVQTRPARRRVTVRKSFPSWISSRPCRTRITAKRQPLLSTSASSGPIQQPQLVRVTDKHSCRQTLDAPDWINANIYCPGPSLPIGGECPGPSLPTCTEVLLCTPCDCTVHEMPSTHRAPVKSCMKSHNKPKCKSSAGPSHPVKVHVARRDCDSSSASSSDCTTRRDDHAPC